MADPELYRSNDKDDPEAVLEGVAMAGLVGVLRQIGDLAEFAAEIFHDLHEEVMATASRGHGLMARVQQLEADFPSIEKAFLSKVDHSNLFHNTGVDWHPNLHIDQNLITQGGLPRFVMDSYEECRGPPRLFLLDKFDVAGAGACLKRYTDPSFYRMETTGTGTAELQVQWDKRIRKVKKRGSRWKNGETPETLPTSHSKLHDLLLEERTQNGYDDPTHHVKLKRRQLNDSLSDSKTGRSYMEKFLESPSPERKAICESSVIESHLDLKSINTCNSVKEIVEISTVDHNREQLQGKRSTLLSLQRQESEQPDPMEGSSEETSNVGKFKMAAPDSGGKPDKISFSIRKMAEKKEIVVLGEREKESNIADSHSEEVTSEVDDYGDALMSMDSELETDSEYKLENNSGFLSVKKRGTYSDVDELQSHFSDSQSTGNSTAYGNNSRKGRYSLSQSDTFSSLAENSLSDTDGTAVFVAEAVCTSSDQLRVSKDILGINSDDLTEFHSTTIGVAEIPNGSSAQGEASCDSCLTASSERGEGFEVSSDYDKICIGLSNSHETGVSVSDSDNMQYSSQVSFGSDARGALSTASAEFHPVEELVASNDSNVVPPIFVLESNIPDLPSKGEGIDNIEGTLHQQEHVVDSFTANMVDGAQTFVSSMEEPIRGLPELDGCSKVELEPDNMVFVVDPTSATGASLNNILSVVDLNTSSATGLNSDNKTTVVDNKATAMSSVVNSNNLGTAVNAQQSCHLSQQHLPEIEDEVSSLKVDPSEIDIQHFGSQTSSKGVSSFVDEETVGCADDVDVLLTYQNSLEFQSDHLSDPILRLANTGIETLLVDGVTPAVIPVRRDVVADVVNDELICFPSQNSKDHQYTLFSPRNSYKEDSDIKEAIRETVFTKSETQKEVVHLTAVQTDSSLMSCNTVSKDSFNLQLRDDTTHPSLVGEMQRGHSADVNIPSLNQMCLDLEISPTMRESHPVDCLENRMSLPDNQLAQPENLIERVLELQVDQSDLDGLHGNELISVALDQEGCFDVSSESCIEEAPIQPSAPHTLPQSTGQKHFASEQSKDQQESNFPSFIQPLPNVSLSNHEEMPPLPPLPPMQWRIGKLIQAIEPAEDSTRPSKMANENDQFGFEEGKPTEHQNSKIQFSTVERELQSEFWEHASGYSAENCHHDFLTVKEAQPQHGSSASDGEMVQSLSPSSAAQSINSHGHCHKSSEGGRLQRMSQEPENSFEDEKLQQILPRSDSDMVNPPEIFMPITISSLKGEPTQHLNQEAETSSEDEKYQQTLQRSESHMVNPPEVSFLPMRAGTNSSLGKETTQHLSQQAKTGFQNENHHRTSQRSERDLASVDTTLLQMKGRMSLYLDETPIQHMNQESMPSLEDGKHQRILRRLERDTIDPSGISVSLMREKTIPFIEEGQIQHMDQKPEISLGDEKHPQTLQSEGDMVNPPETSVSPMRGRTRSSLGGEPIQYSNQEAETSIRDENHHRTLQRSGRDLVCPPETAMSLMRGRLSSYLEERPVRHMNQQSETNFEDEKYQQTLQSSERDVVNPSETSVPPMTEAGEPQIAGDEESNRNPLKKLPRSPDPLIEAVAAHDKSKLKKAAERVRPQIMHAVDKKDNLLEQIRTKSFNLRPAVSLRPRISGPDTNTNLRVAAILEKANAIRQAFVGSDEDDDDNWSDS